MEPAEIYDYAREDSVRIYWDRPEGSRSEMIYHITVDGEDAGTARQTHFSVTGLQEETEYSVAVWIRNQSGELCKLAERSVKTAKKKRKIDVTKAPYFAVGDGIIKNTAALQQAIDDCGPNNVVYLPEGVFLTGALKLHADMELYLEKNAVLQGAREPEDYLPKYPSRFEGLEMECYSALLSLGELDHKKGDTTGNVVIQGEGTIAGGGRELAGRVIAAERERISSAGGGLSNDAGEYESADTVPGRARPRLIEIRNASNVRISGLTIKNGASWNIHMIYSDHILTDHCTFYSENVWNGDGWDPDSSTNCTIFGCRFYTGDDSIAIKSGKNPQGNQIGRPSAHIKIFDCISYCGHGITIGSEMSGGIEDVQIWDCDFGRSMFGMEIKATKKRGGYVRGIRMRHCTVSRILLHSVAYNDDGVSAGSAPVFEDCQFEHVTVFGAYQDEFASFHPCAAIEVCGFEKDEPGISRIEFTDISILHESGESTVKLQYCEDVRFQGISQKGGLPVYAQSAEKEFVINRNTGIDPCMPDEIENCAPICHAVKWFMRDMEHVFGGPTAKPDHSVLLQYQCMEPEAYRICITPHCIRILAGDDLGFVYALLSLSRKYLGVKPFWFWNDQEFVAREEVRIPVGEERSEPYTVRYRGWFLNDEVLISHWDAGEQESFPWEMAMEALLRLGGNMVIPGTDKNAKKYEKLAAELGLWVTHHHAEPLGAEMFARAYPDLAPSFSEHPKLFRSLWRDAIRRQAGRKIVWNIGFRGQGDLPFWENDPSFDTQKKRGELIAGLIREQYDLVKRQDANAVCCTNLYGEAMELYRAGVLAIPSDVIVIWADNGYGKMVSRRQGNHNPRVFALPTQDGAGAHGIYYHVSFYDLQAANHITMCGNSPEFIKNELTKVFLAGADQYWIINCSNVKPHVYLLDLIAGLWKNRELDIERHRKQYCREYYGEDAFVRVACCLGRYAEYAASYGKNEDEHAGEQFFNHPARILISQYMKDKSQPANEMRWAADCDTLRDQVTWYKNICQHSAERYQAFAKECEQTMNALSGNGKRLFEDSILLQARLYLHCSRGAGLICAAILEAFDGSCQRAFYYGGKAKKEYLCADMAMRSSEHGKWKGFYANECLTDIKQTAWVLDGFMAYVRNLGDGPHFFQWQREFLDAKEDRRVFLLLNTENHLKDQELFLLMEGAWDNAVDVRSVDE